MKNLLGGIGRAILLVILFALPAKAEWVTFHIEGIVDNVTDYGNYLEGKAHVGDTISGWYTFDTSTPNSYPYSYGGYYKYNSAPAGVSLQINDLIFETDFENDAFLMTIHNNREGDMYRFESWNNNPLNTGATVDWIFMQLNDISGNALSSNALPVEPPNLNLWQDKWLGIYSENIFTIGAHVTSITPEPGTIIFFVLGALGIFNRRISRE